MREDLPVGKDVSDDDSVRCGEWCEHTTSAIATDGN